MQCLVDSLPLKIAAVAASDHSLVVATSDGALLFFAIHEHPRFNITLVESRKGFADSLANNASSSSALAVANVISGRSQQRRIPVIDAIEMVSDVDLLFCLSDGRVSVCQLSTFACIGSVPVMGVLSMAVERKRATVAGVVADSVEMERGRIMRGVRVAIVMRRRISVFVVEMDKGDMRLEKDIPVPGRPRAIEWLDADRIVYAVSRGYYTVDLHTLKHTELHRIGSGRSGSVGGAAVEPCIAMLPGHRLLLSIRDGGTAGEGRGVFVNGDGSEFVERDLLWTRPPLQVMYSAPYIIALLGGSRSSSSGIGGWAVEVRSLNTGGIVQTVDVPEGCQLVFGRQDIVHIASASSVWRLIPFDFEDQIEHLISANNYQEAQRLIEELEFSSDDDKVANIIRVRGLYAYYLFTHESKYEEAISLLGELKASPVDIINLFPQFSLLGSSGEPPVTDAVALSALIDYLTAHRTILSKLRQVQKLSMHPLSHKQTPSSSSSSLSASAIFSPSSSTSSSSLKHRCGPRSTTSSSLLSTPSTPSRHPPPVGDCAHDSLLLSQIVDTTLLKALLQQQNGVLVGALLRLPNFCDVEEAEAALVACARQSDLVDLFYSKGLHQRGLESLCRELSAGRVDASIVVMYLLKLDLEPNLDLILKFASRVIDQDSDVGLKAFTDRYEPLSISAYRRILDALDLKSVVLERAYLEHMITALGDVTPEFHDRLGFNYLKAIMHLFVSAGDNDDSIASLCAKLSDFLNNSTSYRPDRLLALFPEDALLQERTILLSRLKRHSEALIILIDRLKDFAAARMYCEKHYNPVRRENEDISGGDGGMADQIYFFLFELMLKAEADGRVAMGEVIKVLDDYGRFIDGAKAFGVLPSSIRLEKLVTFSHKNLTELLWNRHIEDVVVSLSHGEQLQTRDALFQCQSGRVTVTEDRMCGRCLKRIGNSVFAMNPTGLLLHVFCI